MGKMKKVLVAVDESKGSQNMLPVVGKLVGCMQPEMAVLLHVQRVVGRSLINELLTGPELSAFKESMKGTDHQEVLDKKSEKILNHYKQALEERGVKGVATMVKAGHPAEEIIATAETEEVDLILVGSRGDRVDYTFTGSVSREVVDRSKVPVLVVK